MDKVGALEFAEKVLGATEGKPNGLFHDGLWMPN